MTQQVGFEPEPMAFYEIPSSIDSKEPLEGKLVVVAKDGRTISLKCVVAGKEEVLDPQWSCIGQFDPMKNTWAYLKKEDCGKLIKEAYIQQGFPVKTKILLGTAAVLRPIDKNIQEAADKEILDKAAANKTAYVAKQTIEVERLKKIVQKKEGPAAIYGARVFHFVTGLLAMQVERIVGVVRLALGSLAAAGGAVALLGVKGAKKIRPGKVTHLEITEKQIGGFVTTALWHVRVALLQLIPIIGPQLANQYRETGSLKGFMHAPAIGGILGKIGGNVAQIVYGPRSGGVLRLKFRRDCQAMQDMYTTCIGFGSGPPHEDANYLALKNPTVEDTKKILEQEKGFLKPVHVRISVPTKQGKTRYHDGTMLLSEKAGLKIDAPTVVMYHANAVHRDSFIVPFLGLDNVTPYLEHGYNVLLPSYSGDYATKGDGHIFKEESTHCSEAAMQEDAAADVAFLKELGVKNIGIYGVSLGGAQAMNCAQAIREEGPKVDFIVLNKTFSDGVSVVGRVVRNMMHSSILARIASSFARRFFLEETEGKERGECDCLDNVAKLRKVVGTKSFESTKFAIIGGRKDPLMGDQTNQENNFAVDLYLAVQDTARERARLIMTDESHSFGHTPELYGIFS